ncbi:MFS transporter [Paenibacillus sp. sptzw28]|uniref:MFS transporter n=1 Tax=Paenibacillus sp. sptzw28 TaxID=715179 RepID=UPI001C6DE686|nr:MFS transporter [Paenibacillus sp. sptzw28]QYR23348.1 MFS transporter [Paenibacillus sp. sptzw28]
MGNGLKGDAPTIKEEDMQSARYRSEPPKLLSILTLTLCAFALTTAEFVIAGILPVVAADLSVSISSAGHLVTAYALGMVIGGPILTVLTVGIPRKPLIVALVLVFIIGNLVAAAAPGYVILLLARLISGLVVATFFAMAVVIAVSLAQPGKQASAVAKVGLGFNLAMILGAPIGTAIGQQFGWRATFLTIAAFTVIALIFLMRFVPVRGGTRTGSVLTELRVLRSRELQLALAITAVGNVGVLTVFTYLAPLLTDISGFGAGSVPVLLLVYGLGATVGNLAGGWMSDRALMPSLIGLLAGLAGVQVLFWLVRQYQVPAAIMVFIIGALAFSVIPAMQTKVLISANAAPTLGIAINASAFQIAAAFAAWLGGRVIDGRLGLDSISLVAAFVTLIGGFLAIASWKRDRKPSSLSQ